MYVGIAVAAAQAAPAAKGPLYEGSPEAGKVSSHLLDARRLARRRMNPQQLQRAVPVVRFVNNKPEIEVRLRQLTPEIVAHVRDIGMQVTRFSYKHARIVGQCDPELLEEIAAIPEVTTIHPNYGAQLHVGSVTSQADISIGAHQARAMFGVDGTGVTVGVLSDSFSDTIGGVLGGFGCARTLTASAPQSAGDLPTPVTVLDNGPGFGTDEGAAMAEHVFDIAPGSAIMFHSAFPDEATFAHGIDNLVDCGADVIVDDVLYFAEPMFQDGIVAQAAQDAVDSGVTFFSSAGNSATFGVDETYADANAPVDDEAFPASGNDFHDFGGGDRFAKVTIPEDCDLQLVLQWNDPFSGTLGPGATTDLDLYVCDEENPATCLPVGFSPQGCGLLGGVGGDPLEIVVLPNLSGAPLTLHIAVDHYCGSEDVRFRIATFGLDCGLSSGYEFEAGIFDQPQIYGHSAARGAAAVAAAFYLEIDRGGDYQAPAGQIDVEPFSSLGGVLPFYFDGTGNPLPGAPLTRAKPEITAPDGTNTTFFGSDIGADPDHFPNFFGTSAAAPHAAGVAALMLEADSTLTPAQLLNGLQSTADDIESQGADALSGAGLINAEAAVRGAAIATPTDTPTLTAIPTNTPTSTRTSTATTTGTGSPTATPTSVGAATTTPTETTTGTTTPTHSRTQTPTETRSHTPSSTPTQTVTVTPSPTQAPSNTPTTTPSLTQPPTYTTANTPTGTSTPTASVTSTFTATATQTYTATEVATPTLTPTPCAGDCEGNGAVSLAELVRGVNIALGNIDLDDCPAFDADGDGAVSINELIRAVTAALVGCAVAT